MTPNIEIHEEPTDSTSLVHSRRDQVRELLHRLSSPRAAAAVAGGVAIGAALLFGVGPTVVGAGAAYAAYRLATRGKAERSSEDSEFPIGGV